MTGQRPTWHAAALAGLVALWATQVAALWFVVDDAFITFRYARNLARGLGLRYNVADAPPVEGYSSLLWTLLATPVEAVGADPAVVMPALSALTGLALLREVVGAAGRLGLRPAGGIAAGAVFAGSPMVGAWSTGGLETMPAAWLSWVCFDRLVLRDDGWRVAVGAGVLLTLARVEGVAWVGVIAALAALRAWWDGRPDRLRVAGAVGVVAVAVAAAQVGWRWQTYGDVVANTARAKVALSSERLWRGARYVCATWVELWVPAIALAGAPLAVRRHGARGAAVALWAVAVPTWCVVIGGDYMAFGRLLLSGLAPAALLFGALVDGCARLPAAARVGLPATLLAAGALPAHGVRLAPSAVTGALSVRATTPWIGSEHEMWRAMRANVRLWSDEGRALAAIGRPEATLVTGAIGARGYFSDLHILDRGGLVTRGVVDGVSPRDPLRHSPGHDVIAERASFLPERPTWLRFADLVGRSGIRRRLLSELTSWRVPESWRDDYGPRVYPVTVGGAWHHVLVLERARDAAEAATWWRSWPDVVASIQEGGASEDAAAERSEEAGIE